MSIATRSSSDRIGADVPSVARRPVRHSADVAKIAGGSAVVAAGAVVASQGDLSNLETDVFRVVNDLPAALAPPLQALMQAGSLAAVPVAVLVALAFRKPRLARDLTVAGLLAYFAARVLKSLVGRGRPGALLQNVVFHGRVTTGLGYPSGHAAVAAALATVASAYLGRRARWLAWALVAVVAIARMYVGAHLPVDVIGGVAVGVVAGALVRLAAGYRPLVTRAVGHRRDRASMPVRPRTHRTA